MRVTALREKQIEGLQAWSVNAFVRPSEPATVSLASLDQAPTERSMCVLGMAVDETRVYAARYHTLNEPPHTSERAGVLVILDRQELRPVPGLPQLPGQPRGVPVGFEPRSVAVNPVSGKVYVVNYGLKSYNLTVIDSATFAVLKTIKLGQAPQQVAVNTKLNRVYVSNTFQRCVQVIDGATDTLLEPIVLGPGPTGVAVDEARNTLYVVIANLYEAPFANGLFAVIDTPSRARSCPSCPSIPLASSPRMSFSTRRWIASTLPTRAMSGLVRRASPFSTARVGASSRRSRCPVQRGRSTSIAPLARCT